MIIRNRQLVNERKKLVISKGSNGPRQGLEHRTLDNHENYQKIDDNQNKKSSFYANIQMPKLKRRSSSKLTSIKNGILTLEKKSTSTYSSSKKVIKHLQKKETYQKIQIISKEQNNEESIRLIGRNQVLQALMSVLIGKFKQNQFLFQTQAHHFLIQKNYFAHVLQYLICILSTHDLLQCNRLFHKLSQLKETYLLVHQYIQSSKIHEKSKCLSITNELFSYEYRHQAYEQNLNQNVNLLKYYTDLESSLSEKIKYLNQELVSKQKLNDELSTKVYDQNSTVNQYHLKIDQLEQKVNNLSSLIISKQKELQNITKSRQKITNYGCQHREMIRIVSKDYKEIESDIYEYATYLQSNELASELEYEPHPFRQIQKNLMSDYNNNSSFCHKKSNENTKEIREYFQRLISFYKKKDSELVKLGQFKTKCIRQFIQFMKRWLNNWELKQEFLVNLRNQFVVENERIHEILSELRDTFFIEDKPQEMLNSLSEAYGKIEENYKIGNSFY